MSIQNQIKELQTDIENLKSNKLSIEDQIEVYKNALSKINSAKSTIDSLKTDIEVIEKNHEKNLNKTE